MMFSAFETKMNFMVGCEISGGLGNQFFRYAVARTILEERKSEGWENHLMLDYFVQIPTGTGA